MALILFRVCPESVIDSRFFFQRNSRFFRTKLFACTLISCCSIVNDLKLFQLLSRVLRDLFIIPHPLEFVKRFLKSFSTFFQELFSTVFPRCGSARLLYHTASRLSRGFSKVFSTFFVIFFGAVSQGVSLADSLHIIALLPPFVKRFF